MIIYKTTNLINGKIYIGKDSINRNDYLGSGVLIKRAIKVYGKNNFKKEILQECKDLNELNLAEIYWINFYNSTNLSIGYNISFGGDGGDTISNHPNRDEIIEKMKRFGIEHWHYGKTTSDDTKELIRNSVNDSYKNDPSIKEKISNTRIERGVAKGDKNPMHNNGEKISGEKNGRYGGAGTTEETRQKLRFARKNAGPVSEESRKKMSEHAKGKNNSMYGRCAYDIWVEKYGKEEADRLKEVSRQKRSAAQKLRQEKLRQG